VFTGKFGNLFSAEHNKGARPSTLGKYQRGQSGGAVDRGEKKENLYIQEKDHLIGKGHGLQKNNYSIWQKEINYILKLSKKRVKILR
jgi:hypothetical protein